MPNVFHAVFGICRRDGGTKKQCYKEAVEVLEGAYGVVVRRRRVVRKKTRKRSRRR